MPAAPEWPVGEEPLPPDNAYDPYPTKPAGPGPAWPKPLFPNASDMPSVSLERQSHTFGAMTSKRPIVYGRNQVGGDIFAVLNNQSSGELVMAMAVSEGPVQGNAGGTDFESASSSGGWTSLQNYLGAVSPTVDSVLAASTQAIVETYPYLAWSRVTFATNAMANIEMPKIILRGRTLYDPRENRIINSETIDDVVWTCTSGLTSFTSVANGISQDTSTANNTAKLVEPGGTGHDMYRQTSGAALITASPVTVSIDAYLLSGTGTFTLRATKVTGGETIDLVCALTTTPRRWSVTLPGGGTGSGEARITLIDIPETDFVIGRAQIEFNSEPYGYKKSAASAVVPVVEYSANPALIMADLKTNMRYGQKAGARVVRGSANAGSSDLRAFWDGSGTKGTLEVEVTSSAASPDQFKWRFTNWNAAAGAYTTGVSASGDNTQLGSTGIYVRWPAVEANTVGDRWTVTIPSDRVNWASVGNGAEWCDQVMSSGNKRYECHIVLREPAAFDDWYRTIGAHFDGRWQFSEGKWYLVTSRPVYDVALTITRDELLESPQVSLGTNQGLLDAQNRVTVTWTDPADDWKQKPVSVSATEVDLGGEIREGQQYQMIGCQNEDQARRTATYILNDALADKTVVFRMSLAGCTLIPGSLVSLTDADVGISAEQYICSSIRLAEDGMSVGVDAREYDPAVFSNVPGATDTPSPTSVIDAFATPPDVTMPRMDSFTYPTLMYWDVPRYYPAQTLQGASKWSNTGTAFGSFTAAQVNNGDLSTTAFTFATAAAAHYLVLDLGASGDLAFDACDVTITNPGTLTFALTHGTNAPIAVQHSPDGAAWTDAGILCTVKTNDTTGAVVGYRAEWTAPAAKRYWRLQCSPISTSTTVTVSEVQFKKSAGTYPYVKKYIIRRGTTATSPVDRELLAYEAPSLTNQVNVTALGTAAVVLSSTVYTSDVFVQVLSIAGNLSAGRAFRAQSSSANTASVDSIPYLRSSDADDRHTGNVRISGAYNGRQVKVEATATGSTHLSVNAPSGQSVDIVKVQLDSVDKVSVDANGQLVAVQETITGGGTGDTHLTLNAPSGQTASIAKFKVNSVDMSALRKDASFATLQSSHVAPFAKGRYNCSGTTTHSNTTVADITGCTTGSFTPATTCTALVIATFHLKCQTYPVGQFRGRLDVNGVEESEQVRWLPGAVDEETTAVGLWRITLTGGTAYTLKLRASLDATTGDVDALATHTGFSVIALGSF